MEIDYVFVEKMLYKHSKHLESVKSNLETYIENHQRQIASLEKLDQNKYGNYKKELQYKLAEALEKLSHVSPNIEKLYEQLAVIATKVVEQN